MHVVGVQLDSAWEDKSANFSRVRALLADARVPPGSLIALPEMFATGFSMHARATAEDSTGPTMQFLSDLAREHASYVIAGMTSAGSGKARNDAVLVAPTGTEQARYTKRHPFSLGGETHHFAGGNDIVVSPAGDLNVCPLVCYDLRFPEDFRAGVQNGAELFVVIANWPAARQAHWSVLLRARAIENQAYVVGINRCGSDPHHPYAGLSAVIDPRGGVLAEADSRETVLQADLDPAELRRYRNDFPALKDMKAERT